MLNYIKNTLFINPEHLKSIECDILNSHNMDLIRNYIQPKSCFNNAIITANILNFDAVVLGVALISLNDNVYYPVEHAWIKSGSQYYDPSYQELPIRNIKYFSLVELTLSDYVEQLNETNCAIDIFQLRRNDKYKSYFFR